MAIECDEIVLKCDNITRIFAVDINDKPVSLTGNRIRFAISRHLDDPAVILKDSDNGAAEIEILASPDDDQALVKIIPADLDGLEEGTYCRSVEITLNSLSPILCRIPVIDTVDLILSGFVNTP